MSSFASFHFLRDQSPKVMPIYRSQLMLLVLMKISCIEAHINMVLVINSNTNLKDSPAPPIDHQRHLGHAEA